MAVTTCGGHMGRQAFRAAYNRGSAKHSIDVEIIAPNPMGIGKHIALRQCLGRTCPPRHLSSRDNNSSVVDLRPARNPDRRRRHAWKSKAFVMDGQIIRQSVSYRQGLVLGLTMAEIMVLLVFCLLIAMTAFLRNEHTAREDAEKNLQKEKVAAAADHQMVESLKGDPRLAELLQGALGSDN